MTSRPTATIDIINALKNSEGFLMGLFELLHFCQTQKPNELAQQHQFLIECLSIVKAQNIKAGNAQLDSFIFIVRNSLSNVFKPSSHAYGYVLMLLQALGYDFSSQTQTQTPITVSTTPQQPQKTNDSHFVPRLPATDLCSMSNESDLNNFNLQLLQTGMQNIQVPQMQLPMQFVNLQRQPQVAMMGQEDAFPPQRFNPPINFSPSRPPSNFYYLPQQSPRAGTFMTGTQLLQPNMGATYIMNNPAIIQQAGTPYRVARPSLQPNFLPLNQVRTGGQMLRQAPLYVIPTGQNPQPRLIQQFIPASGLSQEQSDFILQQIPSWSPSLIRDGVNSAQAFSSTLIRPSSTSKLVDRSSSQPVQIQNVALPSNNTAKPSTVHYLPSVSHLVPTQEGKEFDQQNNALRDSSGSHVDSSDSRLPPPTPDVLSAPTTIRLCKSIPMCDSSPAIALIEEVILGLRSEINVISCIPNSTFVELCVKQENKPYIFKCSHRFIMRDRALDAISSREHIEVQLKCIDKPNGINRWPEGFSVRINETPISPPLLDSEIGDECIFIKQYLCKAENLVCIKCNVPGDSSISPDLPEEKRPVAFRFQVSLVLRSSITVMLRALLNKRTQSVVKSQEFIRHYFNNNPMENARGFTIVSFIDSVSKKLISVPVRGESCLHIQCIDFETLCLTHVNRTHFICPVCKNISSIPNVIIDGFMCSLYSQLKGTPNLSQIKITPESNWTLFNLNNSDNPPSRPTLNSQTTTPKFDISNEDIFALFGCNVPSSILNSLPTAKTATNDVPNFEQQKNSLSPNKKRSYEDKQKNETDFRDTDVYLSEAYTSLRPKKKSLSPKLPSSAPQKSLENSNIMPSSQNPNLLKTSGFSSNSNYLNFGLSCGDYDLFKLPQDYLLDIDPHLSLNAVADKDFCQTPNPMKDFLDSADDEFLKHMDINIPSLIKSNTSSSQFPPKTI